MTQEEHNLLEEYKAVLAEMIKRALLASQRLCEEIQSASPDAIETARDVKKRLEVISHGFSNGGNKMNPNAHRITTLQ
jgi:hypothetical protein